MRFIYFVLIAFVLSSCSATITPEYNKISPVNKFIHYTGRVKFTDSSATLTWPGTQVNIKFFGTQLSVTMDDQNGDNFYHVIIDNDSSFTIHPAKGTHTYILARNLEKDTHTVTLFKRTEYIFGKTVVYSFATDSHGYFLQASSPHKMVIEFYGNSITAGLGNAHPTGSSFNPQYENNYMAYGAITARNLKANYICIARSGIGLTVSWDSLIMPELFWRLDPFDARTRWDFASNQPDIVVVNLFQNDSWLVSRPHHKQFVKRFGQHRPSSQFFVNAYANFIDTLATLYPDAQIICTLGPMSAARDDAPWKQYIIRAVKRLNNPRIHTFFFPYFVRHGHPTVKDHERMATMLTQFIRDSVLMK